MGLSRKTCLRALLLLLFAIQIHGVVATSRKVVAVGELTPHEIEEELQVLPSLFVHSIIKSMLPNS